MSPPLPPVAANMDEANFQRLVMAFARTHGWLVCHFIISRLGDRALTAFSGDAGCPDLILARGGVVMLVELKGPDTRVGPMQRRWAAAAGPNGGVYRPCDWIALATKLAA